MHQKLEFAQRLRDAMQAVGMPARPSMLLEAFNRRYWGRSVSFQAVSRWLRGEAIPEQDKLVVLADMLRIPPDELRFGKVGLRIQEETARRDKALNYLERETFDLFLQLPPAQKKVVREVIEAFADQAKLSPSATSRRKG
ncbi:MAG: hypothetical protein RIQ97_1177 [Pseudomonadota bacterium]|jgi:transcriptional regulator with XRE-family HTH domain